MRPTCSFESTREYQPSTPQDSTRPLSSPLDFYRYDVSVPVCAIQSYIERKSWNNSIEVWAFSLGQSRHPKGGVRLVSYVVISGIRRYHSYGAIFFGPSGEDSLPME